MYALKASVSQMILEEAVGDKALLLVKTKDSGWLSDSIMKSLTS